MKELYKRYGCLECCEAEIEKALDIMIECYENKGKLLVCGNGGSAADSDHIVGELMKGFMLKRPMEKIFEDKLEELFPGEGEILSKGLQGALPAISLAGQSAIFTAFINDVEPDMVYAQLTYGYGVCGDVLIGISTSGNSKNVVNAAKIAKAKGLKIIALVGQKKCKLDDIADVVIHVPETETFKIQELHLPVYHYLCAECEGHFWEK